VPSPSARMYALPDTGSEKDGAYCDSGVMAGEKGCEGGGGQE
jgi:hypothetical protein